MKHRFRLGKDRHSRQEAVVGQAECDDANEVQNVVAISLLLQDRLGKEVVDDHKNHHSVEDPQQEEVLRSF